MDGVDQNLCSAFMHLLTSGQPQSQSIPYILLHCHFSCFQEAGEVKAYVTFKILYFLPQKVVVKFGARAVTAGIRELLWQISTKRELTDGVPGSLWAPWEGWGTSLN